MGYAGDLNVNEAWQLLTSDAKATLVDVRTAPEWSFVGRPDLNSVGKAPLLLSWQVYPDPVSVPQRRPVESGGHRPDGGRLPALLQYCRRLRGRS